jgi:uncharacterized protein (DUF433 family)
MVSVVLDSLAGGDPPEEIGRAYHLDLEDIKAALQYAAELAKERVVPLGVGPE